MLPGFSRLEQLAKLESKQEADGDGAGKAGGGGPGGAAAEDDDDAPLEEEYEEEDDYIEDDDYYQVAPARTTILTVAGLRLVKLPSSPCLHLYCILLPLPPCTARASVLAAAS